MTRAGRPRAAALATGGLLLLTIVLAAVTARHKSRQSEGPLMDIPLDKAGLYPALGLRVRLPEGWAISTPQRFAGGRMLAAVGKHKDSGRQLLVFRSRPNAFGLEGLARTAVRAALPGSEVKGPEHVRPATLGTLPSEILAFVALSSEAAEPPSWVFANVAAGDDRQVVGIILITDGELESRDRRLLDAVSDSVTLESSAPAAPQAPTPTPGEDEPTEDPDGAEKVDAAPFFHDDLSLTCRPDKHGFMAA